MLDRDGAAFSRKSPDVRCCVVNRAVHPIAGAVSRLLTVWAVPAAHARPAASGQDHGPLCGRHAYQDTSLCTRSHEHPARTLTTRGGSHLTGRLKNPSAQHDVVTIFALDSRSGRAPNCQDSTNFDGLAMKGEKAMPNKLLGLTAIALMTAACGQTGSLQNPSAPSTLSQPANIAGKLCVHRDVGGA